jgi:hypothetical protein
MPLATQESQDVLGGERQGRQLQELVIQPGQDARVGEQEVAVAGLALPCVTNTVNYQHRPSLFSNAVRYTVIWTTMVLAAALAAPQDKDKLTVSNVRATHGMMGPTRAGEKVLPGDELDLCFDVEGATVDDEGKVRYSIAVEVADSKGKTLFKQDPKDLEAPASLGGDRIPAYAHLDVGLQSPPGEYTFVVTVVDLPSKRSQQLKRTVEVLPKDFGLVRVKSTRDQEGQIPAVMPGVGEGLWLSFGAIGFARGGDGTQPDLTFEMRVLDEDGKPTRSKPVAVHVNKDVPADAALVPGRFFLSLNRSGKFTVELTATDKASGKKAQLTIPLNVREAN